MRLKFKNTVLEFFNKDSESTRLDVVGVAFKIVMQEDVTSVCIFQAIKKLVEQTLEVNRNYLC